MNRLDEFIVPEQRLADQASGYDPQWRALADAVTALAAANQAIDNGPGTVDQLNNAWVELLNQCTGVGSSPSAGAS